jgi:small subunit ribosomal protein S17
MKCDDINCPFHGSLKIRKNRQTGIVVSTKRSKTITIQKEVIRKVPKYERYMRSRRKISAHLPPCISVKEGDCVQIAGCRPLSKTKSFVVIKKIVKNG